MKPPRRPTIWIATALLTLTGCGAEPSSNRSPTADADPQRAEKARRESQQYMEESHQREAEFFHRQQSQKTTAS